MSGFTQEFQLVFLAGGYGRRLGPLADETAKALLPVCNRPILSYELETMENAGFTHAIVLTRESSADQIRAFLNERYKGKMKLDIVVLSDYLGTAQALLKIKDKLKRDFIVVSSDIIMEGDFIHAMLDSHRAKDAAVTVLVKEQPDEDPAAAAAAGAVKKPKRINFDFVGMTEQRRLLLLSSTEDFEETFRLKRKMLKQFPNVTLNTTLSDPHLYVFSRWTLDLLEKRNEEKKCSSLKHDFLPFLLKCQYEPHLYQDIDIPVKTGLELTMSSTPTDMTDKLYCQSFLIDSKVFCMRANTMDGFLEANRDIATGTKPYKPSEPVGKGNFISASAVIGKTQIGTECVVSDGTTVGDRSSVKKSIIGKHCQIGNNVKIINSVLLDHVTVKDGAKIQNCVICSNAYINENASLVDSQVGPKRTVDANANLKKETVGRKSD